MRGRELIAWNLRRLRVAAGLSQVELAGEAEVDRAYLGGLENQRENPTVDLLDRIVTRLNVRMAELFAEPVVGETPPKPLKAGRRKV